MEDWKQRLGEVYDATASFVWEDEQLERRDDTIRVFFALLFRSGNDLQIAASGTRRKVKELCFCSRKAINNGYAEYAKIRGSFSGCEERAGGDQNTASPQQQACQRDRVPVT